MYKLITLSFFLSYFFLFISLSVFSSVIDLALFSFLLVFILSNSLRLNYVNIILISSLLILIFINLLHGISNIHIGSIYKSIFILLLYGYLLSDVIMKKSLFNSLASYLSIIVFLLQAYLMIKGTYFGDFLGTRDGTFNGVFVAAFIFDNTNSSAAFFLSLIVLQSLLPSGVNKAILMAGTLFLLFLTFSRSAFVLGALIMLLSNLYYLKKYKVRFLILFTLVSFFVFSYYSTSLTVFFNKFFEGGDSGRFYIWTTVLDTIIYDPLILLFGNGASTTFIELNGIKLSSHSSYINTFSNMGLIYLCLLFITLCWKVSYLMNRKSINRFLIFIAVLLYGITESALFEGPSSIWFIAITLLNLSFIEERNESY